MSWSSYVFCFFAANHPALDVTLTCVGPDAPYKAYAPFRSLIQASAVRLLPAPSPACSPYVLAPLASAGAAASTM